MFCKQTLILGAVLSALLQTTLAGSSQCISFYPVSKFNLVTFGDYSNPSSDIQGRAAVGGNAVIGSGFSVNDRTPVDNTTRASNDTGAFYVAGTLNWPGQGQVYNGNAYAAAGSNVNKSVFDNGYSLQTYNNQVDFVGAKAQLTTLSATLSAMATTLVNYSTGIDTSINFTLSGEVVEVVTIPDCSIFANGRIRMINPIQNLAANSTLIFNLQGASCGFVNMNMETLSTYSNRIIWNFQNATTLTINGVAVYGSILAPNAVVTNATGKIDGNVVVQSLAGPVQINLAPFQAICKKCKQDCPKQYQTLTPVNATSSPANQTQSYSAPAPAPVADASAASTPAPSSYSQPSPAPAPAPVADASAASTPAPPSYSQPSPAPSSPAPAPAPQVDAASASAPSTPPPANYQNMAPAPNVSPAQQTATPPSPPSSNSKPQRQCRKKKADASAASQPSPAPAPNPSPAPSGYSGQ